MVVANSGCYISSPLLYVWQAAGAIFFGQAAAALFYLASTSFFPLFYVWQHLLYFILQAPVAFFGQLSSPLFLPMMKLSNSIHYLEYELIIKNLWGTWHHYQPPLHYLLLYSVLWCLDTPSSWSNDEWHVSETSTTATTHFLYCCFIGLLWFIDLFDFLYLLAYLKHTFLHLLEQSAK